ncbi:nucleoporin NUP159-like [Cotesia glomerata]|uniref:nucleoporin NUP159-like n=1 Tax=Cotesia glomerata TaxID=32391 RepID=UPI001D031438|nr:nucleoporin NUP159-like [Cotesia glomerata]
MNLVNIFGVLILFLSKVLAEDQNVTATKETLYTLEFPGSLENETELIEIDFADNIRDKRALGIILQGLVQALGYNTTPIQIASLPNSGSMQLGPITLDLRNARVVNSSPNPAPTMATAANSPRQRETLRFTGVVNFGNGTNIADHLRRYEGIFHGNGTPPAAPVAPTAAPTAAPVPPSPLPLLQPVFFPIPIPLAENLRYPKPLLSVVSTAPSATDPPNPVLDPRVPSKPQPKPTPAPESIEERPSSAESGEKDLSGNGYQKNESQELEDEREASKETEGNQVDENESSEEMMAKLKESLSSPEEYAPKFPKFSKGFGLNLPIEIKPFRGQLMNSYGHSLEHDGKIDPSVADFFAKYKNPRTGVFEPLKIDVPEDSVEKLPEKYLNKQNKYEEYDLKDEKDDEIQNVSNEDLREENYEDDNEEEEEEGEEEDEEEEEGNVAAEMLKEMQNQKSVRQPQQNLQNVPQYNQNSAISPGNDARVQNVPFGGQPYNNFGNLNPYYKPVQYFYSPDSLERTAQRVASYQNDPNFVNMNQGFPPSGEAFIRANPEYLGPRIAKRIAARDQNISTNKGGNIVSTIGDKRDQREEPVVRTLSQTSRKLEEKITVSRSSSPKRRDSLASTSTSNPRNEPTSTSTPVSPRRAPASTSVPVSSREETKRRTDRRRSGASGSRNRNPEIVNENRGQFSTPINVKRNVDSTRSVRGRSRN